MVAWARVTRRRWAGGCQQNKRGAKADFQTLSKFWENKELEETQVWLHGNQGFVWNMFKIWGDVQLEMSSGQVVRYKSLELWRQDWAEDIHLRLVCVCVIILIFYFKLWDWMKRSGDSVQTGKQRPAWTWTCPWSRAKQYIQSRWRRKSQQSQKVQPRRYGETQESMIQ